MDAYRIQNSILYFDLDAYRIQNSILYFDLDAYRIQNSILYFDLDAPKYRIAYRIAKNMACAHARYLHGGGGAVLVILTQNFKKYKHKK